MIASEGLSLLPDQYGRVSPEKSGSPRGNLISSPGQHKGQATKAKLAQKGKCPRLSFTFNSNRIQCEKQPSTASGGSVHWPLPGKQVLVPTKARSWVTCHLTCSLSRGRWGCGSDSEETCLSYSSLGRSSCVFNMKHFTVKSNPKTSWIQSSHTFKHDFIWY